MKTTLTTLLALLALTVSSFAGKSGWDDDYEKSLAKAKTDNKHVLLDFTGSDWCGWCIKLDGEVFSKGPFKAFAKKNLQLVELDYPRSKRVPAKVQKQNAELKSQYKISGYPTIVLLDSAGKEVKRWVGYSANFFDELKAAVPETPAPSASSSATK